MAEAWPDHAFLLETCCLASHEVVCQGMADEPEWARGLLRRLGAEELCGGGRLRRVADGGCGRMLLDRNLAVRPVGFAAAADFVRRHHAHCGAPTVIWIVKGVLDGSCAGAAGRRRKKAEAGGMEWSDAHARQRNSCRAWAAVSGG